MISMTGYAHCERTDETVTASVEVKSVNNRYLDINLSLPGSLSPLEPAIRERITATAARGRVDVTVRLRELEEDLAVSVDRKALSGYLAALNELREAAGIDEPVALEHVLGLEGVIKSERAQDRERYWAIVEPLLSEALERFAAIRREEGARLARDVERQIARVETVVNRIAGHADEIDRQVKANLGDRFAEVLGDRVEESRMLAEVAVQLTRFSINEEIVRLTAHLESFRTMGAGGGPVGKRLDFLCQEMNREINTVGSKSIVLAISEQVVEAKDALENVREQLRNVE